MSVGVAEPPEKENQMTTEVEGPDAWTEVERPAMLTRRFEFPGYVEARAFLERLAGLSKETGMYPDLSFGRTHVNVTVYGSDGTNVGADAREFAVRTGALSTVAVA